jgi:hypothetical protein
MPSLRQQRTPSFNRSASRECHHLTVMLSFNTCIFPKRLSGGPRQTDRQTHVTPNSWAVAQDSLDSAAAAAALAAAAVPKRRSTRTVCLACMLILVHHGMQAERGGTAAERASSGDWACRPTDRPTDDRPLPQRRSSARVQSGSGGDVLMDRHSSLGGMDSIGDRRGSAEGGGAVMGA